MSSHQNHAKKDTCSVYNFAKDKKYIKEKLMLSNMFFNMLNMFLNILLIMILIMFLIMLANILAIMFAIILLIIINVYILYNKILTYTCIRINLYICMHICCVRRNL